MAQNIIRSTATITAPTVGNANGLDISGSSITTYTQPVPSAGQWLVDGGSGTASWSNAITALYVSTADATVNSTTEGTLVGSGVGSLTITPVQYMCLRITASGYYTAATGGPTVNLLVYKGSTVIAQFIATTAFATASTSRQWVFRGDLVFASTTQCWLNDFWFGGNNGSSPYITTKPLANSAFVTVSSGAEAIDLRWKYGGTIGTSTITCTNFVLERLYPYTT